MQLTRVLEVEATDGDLADALRADGADFSRSISCLAVRGRFDLLIYQAGS
jgi:hypothetical protein